MKLNKNFYDHNQRSYIRPRKDHFQLWAEGTTYCVSYTFSPSKDGDETITLVWRGVKELPTNDYQKEMFFKNQWEVIDGFPNGVSPVSYSSFRFDCPQAVRDFYAQHLNIRPNRSRESFSSRF